MVNPAASHAPLALQLLGPFAILRHGAAVPLPPSRKVRALIAYLAMAPRALPRSHLCELLWDLPNDPRGELRWCLSKARALLDAPAGQAPGPRIVAEGDLLRLDLAGAPVDALALGAAVQAGLAALPAESLRALAAQAGGEFLQGLEIERSAPWSTWLLGQRRHLRAARVAVLEQLARTLAPGSDEALACLEAWLQLAPFDRQAHALLLDALARRGRLQEGEQHLAAAMRLFESEAQDAAPLGRAWREARLRHGAAVATMPASPRAAPAPSPEPATPATAPRRASVAVMPFAEPAQGVAWRGGLADGLAFDVITRLARLRSLFVIAPGTVFALDARRIGAEEAGRTLGVDYVAGGTVRRASGRIAVAVQLSETRSARLVWADTFDAADGDAAFGMLDTIVDRIVAAIASQVEQAERQRAMVKPPNSLDAWESHHRGLWHVMRFTPEDNAQARHYFEAALRLDPGFARPWAGLSFTHFQDAFLGWHERGQAVEQAYRSASQALMADELDPAAHWALGRALWLRGQLPDALAELDTSIELSPNFAHAHYTRGFVECQSGDPRAAIEAIEQSRRLSPFDPLLFAMLAARALALVRLGRHDEAAELALKAAARPNAHVHILSIAAHCLALAGRSEPARAMAARIQQQQAGYRSADLLGAFRLADDAQALLRQAAARVGMG